MIYKRTELPKECKCCKYSFIAEEFKDGTFDYGCSSKGVSKKFDAIRGSSLADKRVPCNSFEKR